MAKGFKTGGRNWKKGESGNIKGPAPFPIAANKVTTLAVAEYADLVSAIFYSTHQEAEDIAADPSETLLRRTAAGVMLKAFTNKCPMTLEMLLSRVLGRVRDVSPKPPEDASRKAVAVLEEFRKVINDPKNERS